MEVTHPAWREIIIRHPGPHCSTLSHQSIYDAFSATYPFQERDGAYVCDQSGFGESSLVSNSGCWVAGYSVDTTFVH